MANKKINKAIIYYQCEDTIWLICISLSKHERGSSQLATGFLSHFIIPNDIMRFSMRVILVEKITFFPFYLFFFCFLVMYNRHSATLCNMFFPPRTVSIDVLAHPSLSCDHLILPICWQDCEMTESALLSFIISPG